MPARAPDRHHALLASLLGNWLADVPGAYELGNLAVSGLCNDSRQLRPGDLFLAVPGRRTSGAQHIAQAVADGAAAVLVDAALAPPAGMAVPVLALPDLAARQGVIAARFHGEPSHALKVIGITGTNGKTSVACRTAPSSAQRGTAFRAASNRPPTPRRTRSRCKPGWRAFATSAPVMWPWKRPRTPCTSSAWPG